MSHLPFDEGNCMRTEAGAVLRQPTGGLAGPPTSAYLAAAGGAGVRHELSGDVFVAGDAADHPLTGSPRCLVEYAADGLLADATTVARLLHTLRDLFPEATAAVLRTPGGRTVPTPFTPMSSYLAWLAGTAAPPTAGGLDLEVGPAAQADTAAVRGWLAQAAQAGADELGEPVDGVDEAADEVWTTPGRVSLVARRKARAIGHATMVPAYDEPTGTDYVDLVDILVEPPDPDGEAHAALVAAAIRHAARQDQPLVGHVVHPSANHPEHAKAAIILAKLRRSGWVPAFAYWHAPLPGRAPGYPL